MEKTFMSSSLNVISLKKIAAIVALETGANRFIFHLVNQLEIFFLVNKVHQCKNLSYTFDNYRKFEQNTYNI